VNGRPKSSQKLLFQCPVSSCVSAAVHKWHPNGVPVPVILANVCRTCMGLSENTAYPKNYHILRKWMMMIQSFP
jgi:hypothetical protein